ncbi:MAG: HAD family phosphatase [Clostridiaceae bacterium]|nr:HAD family phosphatase [Clostridiaceae bacterium]
MKYKLLCTDMDGTLLNNNKEISEVNRKAIKRAVDTGIIVAVCTGRIFTFANYYAEILGIKAPVIASNGAYIKHAKSDEVLYKKTLGIENCRKIMQVLKKNGINPHFNSKDRILTGYISHSSESYLKFNENLDSQHQFKVKVIEDWESAFIKYEEDILKCIAIDNDLEKIRVAKEEISSIDSLEVVSSLYNNFEVMAKGVSKGKAVEFLANYYNIKREEIICIGDNENDLSMIDYAGLGVAMGNSSEEIKLKSDYITTSNDADGVANVIEKFIL